MWSFFPENSPDCGVHAAVIELFVVQLSKERKQDLDASYRVDGTVDRVGNDGLHILWWDRGTHLIRSYNLPKPTTVEQHQHLN